MTLQQDVAAPEARRPVEVIVEGSLHEGQVLEETATRVQVRFESEGVTQVRWFLPEQVLRDE